MADKKSTKGQDEPTQDEPVPPTEPAPAEDEPAAPAEPVPYERVEAPLVDIPGRDTGPETVHE